jgi:hypothetical protein
LREKRRLRVLRRILGSKRDEVIGEWRKLHIEELNNLYSSPNIVMVIKIEKNKLGEACNAYGGEKMCIQGFGGETSGKRDLLGDPGIDGKIKRWTFKKWDVEVLAGLGWLRIGTGGGHL